jgi:hypothetical protein
MTKIPWEFHRQLDPNHDYIVAATTGLAVEWWKFHKIFVFQRYTLQIVEALRRSKGCIGFVLRATFQPLGGATISVWADVESLRYFQKENPHGEAVRLLHSNTTGGFQYVQWKCRGDTLPRTWEEAEDHFKPRE